MWWANRPDFRFPRDWQAHRFRQRDIAFAWGPTADRELRRTASVELVIASGSGAGKGSACFDHLVLRRLPDTPSPDEPREFDSVTVRWPAGAGPSRYDLQFSDDGSTWRTVRHVERARGDVQHHFFPDAQARAVRVLAGTQPAAIELGEAADANAFFAAHRQAVAPGRVPARLRRRAVVLDRLRRRRRTRGFAAERGRRGRAGAGGRRARAVSRQRRARRELGRRPHQPLPARRRPADAGHATGASAISAWTSPRSAPASADDARAVVRYTVRNLGKRTAQARARARLAALPGESADAVPRPSRRRQPDRDPEVGRRRPLGQWRAAPEADAAAEQRSPRAGRGRAGGRLARGGAAGGPGARASAIPMASPTPCCATT